MSLKSLNHKGGCYSAIFSLLLFYLILSMPHSLNKVNSCFLEGSLTRVLPTCREEIGGEGCKKNLTCLFRTRTDSVQKVCGGIWQSLKSRWYWHLENKSQVWPKRSAQIKKFIKMKSLVTPKLCWADEVKSKFWGHLKGQNAKKRWKIGNRQIVFGDFCKKYWSQRCQNLHSSSHQYSLQMFFYKNVSI